MRFISRLLRAVLLLARDNQIPRGIRWLAAFSVAPVPGPLDEAALVVVAGVLWVFYRPRLTAAWNAAAEA